MRQYKLLEKSSPLWCLVRRKRASFDVKCAPVGFFRTSRFIFPVPLLTTWVEKNSADKIKKQNERKRMYFQNKTLWERNWHSSKSKSLLCGNKHFLAFLSHKKIWKMCLRKKKQIARCRAFRPCPSSSWGLEIRKYRPSLIFQPQIISFRSRILRLLTLGSLRYGDHGLRTTAGRALSFVCSTGLSRANIER